MKKIFPKLFVLTAGFASFSTYAADVCNLQINPAGRFYHIDCTDSDVPKAIEDTYMATTSEIQYIKKMTEGGYDLKTRTMINQNDIESSVIKLELIFVKP